MSELKAGVIVTPHDEGMSFDRCSDAIAVTERETEFYLKSEADKVIAEKDAEIARLKAIRKVHVEAIESMGAGIHQDEEEILHQKYKRCLAMARWCRTSARCDEGLGAFRYRDWYWKWFKRWLEFAEKFKPNKEADDGND